MIKETLKLLLIRQNFTFSSTLGELFQVDYANKKTVHLAYTLEDAVGTVKVYGDTAIPAGTYEVKNTYSNRFKRTLPLVLDVTEFQGIRIHGGNSNKDTLGCILVGANQDVSTERIWNCAIPLQFIMDLIDKYEKCILEIL